MPSLNLKYRVKLDGEEISFPNNFKKLCFTVAAEGRTAYYKNKSSTVKVRKDGAILTKKGR